MKTHGIPALWNDTLDELDGGVTHASGATALHIVASELMNQMRCVKLEVRNAMGISEVADKSPMEKHEAFGKVSRWATAHNIRFDTYILPAWESACIARLHPV